MNTREWNIKKLKGKTVNPDAQDKLTDARHKKDDEWYTDYQMVHDELSQWAEKYPEVLEGKRILCPCDWDILDDDDCFSMTVEFAKNPPLDPDDPSYDTKRFTYTANRVKKVHFTLWDQEDYVEREVEEAEAAKLLRDRAKCNFLRCLIDLGKKLDIQSITASGYDPSTGRGISFEDIHYSDYDLVITNPPFSKLTSFIDAMNEQHLARENSDRPFNYIILTPFLNRTTPNVGQKLMLHQAFLGFGAYLAMRKNGTDEKKVRVDWITSLPQAQDERNEACADAPGLWYNDYKDDIPTMTTMQMKDRLPVVKVRGTKPLLDTNLWQFVTGCMIGNLDWRQFEMYMTSCKRYFNTDHPEKNPFNRRICKEMLDGGFDGWVIKRKAAPVSE